MIMNVGKGLLLSHSQLEQMITQARVDAPLETCGLLSGQGSVAERVLPVPNAMRSPVEFEMRGQEFGNAMIACNFEPLAIYHSHPHGPPIPSPTDIARAAYPDSIYIIISLAQEPPSVRAFQIIESKVAEVRLEVT